MEESTLTTLEAIESQGRAAYVVMGGEAMNPAAFRSQLESSWQQALSGNSVSTNILTEAYGVSSVAFAGSNYRARTVSEVPPMVADPDGNKTDWNPIMGFMPHLPTVMWYTEMGLIIWGVVYLRKWYNTFGYPVKLEWIHPDDINVQTDFKGNPENYYIEGVKHSTSQIIELRTFDPSRSLNGKSEFEVALARITTEQSIIRHAGSFFFNSARPDGMLVSKHKLNTVDRQKAEKEWKKFKGTANEWRTFVSSSEWEWIPITTTPVDLAMPELSATVKRDICTIMGVNPALIGVADVGDPLSAIGTFREVQRNHIENVTLPRFSWICQALNEQWLYTDFDDEGYYSITADRAAMPILSDVTQDRATTAITLVNPTNPIMDYDEGRAIMNIPARQPDTYFSRPVGEATQVWAGSGMPLDEYRKFIGLKPIGGDIGTLWRLPDGKLIKQADLLALADKTLLDPAPAGNPFGLSLEHNPALDQTANPGLVTLPPNKIKVLSATVRKSNSDSNGCSILLSFANNPQIAAIQTLTRAKVPDGESFYWHTPDEFHITMLYCERLDPDAERKLYGLMEKAPKVGLLFDALAAFPAENDDDETAVYLGLAGGNDALADLMAFQRQLYDKAADAGAVLSAFSNPDSWTPHVTLYYAPGKHKPPVIDAGITCVPAAYVFSRESYDVTQTFAAPVPDEPPAETDEAAARSELLYSLRQVIKGFKLAQSYGWSEYIIPGDNDGNPTIRRQAEISFVGYWPDNNFILMAQRMAARVLQEADFTSVEWLPDSAGWSMPMLEMKGNPTDASRMMLSVGLGDTPKLDLIAERFAVHGNFIGLELAESEMLGKVRAALTLEVESAGVSPNAGESWKAFIPLGTLQNSPTEAARAALDTESERLGFPLVLTDVSLFVDDQRRAGWELRSASGAQLNELNNWRRKVTGRRGLNAPFDTTVLRGSLAESFIRANLPGLAENDKDGITALFARAQKLLVEGLDYEDDIDPTPDEYKRYWDRFDSLDDDIGAEWLAYMQRAEPSILETLSADIQLDSILGLLSANRDKLLNEWVGTEDAPGVITKLVLAGMAAGNEALLTESSMNPNRANPFSQGKNKFTGGSPGTPNASGAVQLTIDWTLLSQEALNFARKYSFELIRGIDQTTQAKVQDAFASWIQSGKPLADLRNALQPIFNDANRAAQIAQTESIRVYNEGAFDRWRQVGVKRAVWRTVRDVKVCPICRPLNGQIGEIDAGWIHPGGQFIDPYDNANINGEGFRGQVFKASAHPGCRCFRRPLIETAPGTPPPKKPNELVNKTQLAGQNLDAVLLRAEQESASIRAKIDSARAKRSMLEDDTTRQEIELEAGLGDKMRAAQDAWWKTTADRDSDEWEKLRVAQNKLVKKYRAARAKIDSGYTKAISDYQTETADLLRSAKPTISVLQPRQDQNLTDVQKQRARDAELWLNDVFDGEQ